jgi:uracil-DNA glycosylase
VATKTKKASTREAPGALPFVPENRSLAVLREAVQHCQGCNIYRHATQAVFGQMEGSTSDGGAPKARMMMIGEQPGDREDKEGQPFVGPAGKLLDQCFEEAGIDRKTVYVTNTVKHFKWEPRGKVRIHKKPSSSEIFACRPWLDAELETVRPALIVCLGAVAAQSLLGSRFKVTESHGTIQQVENLPPIVATFHPASILRALKDDERHRQTGVLISDLKIAQKLLHEQAGTNN